MDGRRRAGKCVDHSDPPLSWSQGRGCGARLACLAGALERREPWGVWGGELLMSGAIVPHKRPRGRPRKDVVTIGANA